ncbi:hypothetical protein [Phytohabitans aurantiacus]|uniref:hypothetical protein n=1 Tax=Phytohabitans aurantiacus TaxID=3016789 RepID=UPI002492E3E1|nr:hypothetical protein [Phytohabitans aurantiacus]
MKLTKRTGVRALVMVPAVLLTLAGTATAASAGNGTPSGAPPAANGYSVWCVSTTGARACFASYGDKVWVDDTKANGQSAAGTIVGKNWNRQCFNDRGADAGWVMCDFDVPEYQDAELWAVNNPFIGSQAYTDINTGNII